MSAIGFNEPLHVLRFDHRGSLQTKTFGWPGTLSSAQTTGRLDVTSRSLGR
jgi:hypothetical protein